jgi:hypothetical protein
MFSYLGLTFQVNRSPGRHRNTGQQRLYEFCYLFPFDLWTSYLAKILFLKGYGSWFGEFPNHARISNLIINWFWEFSSLQRSLMGCNILFMCGKNS